MWLTQRPLFGRSSSGMTTVGAGGRWVELPYLAGEVKDRWPGGGNHSLLLSRAFWTVCVSNWIDNLWWPSSPFCRCLRTTTLPVTRLLRRDCFEIQRTWPGQRCLRCTVWEAGTAQHLVCSGFFLPPYSQETADASHEEGIHSMNFSCFAQVYKVPLLQCADNACSVPLHLRLVVVVDGQFARVLQHSSLATWACGLSDPPVNLHVGKSAADDEPEGGFLYHHILVTANTRLKEPERRENHVEIIQSRAFFEDVKNVTPAISPRKSTPWESHQVQSEETVDWHLNDRSWLTRYCPD